ncbi:MAG: lactate racemase domain-containing protein, partial [Myxococcota bacterium]
SVLSHDAAGTLSTLQPDVRTPEARRAGVAEMPARFHPAVAQAEALMCIGLVEPDLFCGFSGGAAVISMGCASAETIHALRGLAFLRSPEVRIGRVQENPLQGALWRLVRDLPPQRGVMAVPPVGRESWSAFAGPLQHSFQRAVALASERLFNVVDAPRPWMHVLMPPARASSFYEAAKAAIAIALAPNTALAPSGYIVLEAECPEGLGRGPVAEAFAEALRRGPQDLLSALTAGTESVPDGAQHAFVFAKALERAKLVLLGASDMPELAAFGVQQFSDLAAARAALGLKGRVPKLDNVLHAVPVLAKPQ